MNKGKRWALGRFAYNTATDVRADAEGTPSGCDKGTLSAGAATRRQLTVVWIYGTSINIVIRF